MDQTKTQSEDNQRSESASDGSRVDNRLFPKITGKSLDFAYEIQGKNLEILEHNGEAGGAIGWCEQAGRVTDELTQDSGHAGRLGKPK